MSDLTFLSAVAMAEQIRKKKISPLELADAHLAKIERLNPKLNAFVHMDEERVRREARNAEGAVMSGKDLGPLHGIPISVKSSLDVAGLRCEAGTRLRAGYVATEDAPLVARLRNAGAIVLGVTNTPELLMAWETDNLLYGRTNSPWDLERTPGGSSGGEAAAIAAGMSAGGVGSDGGGSIRVPAHFSGICGLKPTPGRIPSTGHFPPGAGAFSWIGVVGPMARTIADVRALFEIMAGPDQQDVLSARVPLRSIEPMDLKSLRVGVLESAALGKVCLETQSAVRRAAELLAAQGFIVELLQLKGLDRAIDLWWFFFGPTIAHLLGSVVAGREDQVSPMLREYLACAEPESPLTLDQFLAACAERDIVRGEILRQMTDVPIVLSPVSSAPAFRHGEGNWRPRADHCYRDTMRHSQWLNLAGFPGVALPLGSSSEGMPIGVQVIGRPQEEELVLAVAERLEQARGPWQ